MVKVKEDSAMAEAPKPATTTQTSINNPTNNNNSLHNNIRKPRNNGHNHTHHLHQTFHHYTYVHHHCTFSPDNPGDGPNNGSTSPAKFYFGPGFEPQAQIPGGSFGPGPSQVQNNSEYVVLLHVNPGVTINFQIGDNLEILRGPVTVPMVSTNSSPPIAMPVQVPPGHVVQQIVDESGTLRHVILSPQHPAGLVPLPSHNPQHYGAGPGGGTNQPQAAYFQSVATGFPPPHFHSNVPPGHPGPSPTHIGHSPPPNPSYYKDERTQRQHIKLKKKILDKQKLDMRSELINGLKRTSTKEKEINSVGTSEDGEESSIPDEEDSVLIVADFLSSVQAPQVPELSSRSALLQWAPPTKPTEATASSETNDIDVSDLRYEVLLSDKSKEMKFKCIYSGASLTCRIRDLRPGQEYSVCLQVYYEQCQGNATDPVKFTTPPCEPDAPPPPKLHQRLRNSFHLKWNAANDNGSHITNYILEYDEGKGGDFVEFHRGKVKQHTIHKLQPATAYRFRLAAVNDVGQSAYSEIVTYHTCKNPPAKPDPPSLVEASVNSLQLAWSAKPGDEDFVLQMNDPNTKYYIPVYNGKETRHVCQALGHFTEYKFRLRAENDGGHSTWSDEVAYKTLPDRPARPSKPIVKGRIHAHSFKLKWEAPSDTGGAPITSYVLEVNSGTGYETVYEGGDTEAVCDKLTPGTTYQLRVSCVSDGGTSNYSDPCTVTTDAISPGECPQPKLHGKPKANSVTIRWSEPDYNGGAPILEYEVKITDKFNDDDTCGIALVQKSRDMEYTVVNLSPGCDYAFAVRAVNRIGPGNWSAELNVTSGAAPPDAPAAPSVTCTSPFHALVEWLEPQSNGAPVTEYKLEMSPQDADDHFHGYYQGAERSCDVKGLVPFSTYYFRVQALNSAGFSPFSTTSATMTPAAAPSVVTSLRHESTPASIRLHWKEPPHNGSPITHYNIEIGDRTISTEDAATEFLLADLNPDTAYKIKVQAVNAVGAGSFSSALKASTSKLPPAAPKLECIGVAHNFLKLKWGEGLKDFTQYTVEMENVRSHEFQCVYKGTALNYKVNKLHELTTYKFRINASNDTAGMGEFSEVYEFATGVAPPVVLKAPKLMESEQRSCVLEWTPGKNYFSDPVIYQVQAVKTKDQTYKEVYKGSEMRCSVEDLDPGVDYGFRVCPIRVTPSGELAGGWSPPLHFSTQPTEPTVTAKQSTATSSSPSHHPHKSRPSLTSMLHMNRIRSISQQPAFYACLIVIAGIIIATWIMSFF